MTLNLAGLFASAFAPFYKSGSMLRSVIVDDGYGGLSKTSANLAINYQIDERRKSRDGAVKDEITAIILSDGVVEPTVDDELLLDGTIYSINDIKTDPANTHWVVTASFRKLYSNIIVNYCNAVLIEVSDTVYGTAYARVSASASIIEANDTVSAIGVVKAAASASISESPDTVSAIGVVKAAASASISESPDTVSANASVRVGVTASITESPDSVSSSATATSGGIVGTANITETPDIVSSSCAVRVGASAAITEAQDAVSSNANVRVGVTATISESADVVSAAASARISASASITEANDTVTATGAVRIGANASATEANDSLSSAATGKISASGAMTESNDTVSSAVTVSGGSLSISVTNSATSSSSTITCPPCSNGDLIVLCDRAENTMSVPSTAVPPGFTSIVNTTDSAYYRQIISYKIANGTEGGTSLAGMSGNDYTYKGIFVIHGTGAISSVSVNSAAGVATDGDPSAQTVASGSGTSPLIVLGAATSYKDNTSLLSMGPSADDTISPDASWQFGYKIFNSSPVNVTVDMSDAGYENCLQSCYLQVQ